MKSKSLAIAIAVAGTFAYSAGALAHGFQRSAEIQTPASVSESAPWLTGQPHLAGWSGSGSKPMSGIANERVSDASMSTATGASSSMSSSGSGSYDSTLSSASDSPMMGRVKHVEYWLLGDESASRSGGSIMRMSDSGTTGMSSSASGSGSVAFDSRTAPSSEQSTFASVRETTPRLTEHYLVLGGLETFDPSNALVFETGSRPERFALLDHLSRDFYVLTPIVPVGDA